MDCQEAKEADEGKEAKEALPEIHERHYSQTTQEVQGDLFKTRKLKREDYFVTQKPLLDMFQKLRELVSNLSWKPLMT